MSVPWLHHTQKFFIRCPYVKQLFRRKTLGAREIPLEHIAVGYVRDLNRLFKRQSDLLTRLHDISAHATIIDAVAPAECGNQYSFTLGFERPINAEIPYSI